MTVQTVLNCGRSVRVTTYKHNVKESFMSTEKARVFPPSTCVECGRTIPSGQLQRCVPGGFCTHYIPPALREAMELQQKRVEMLQDALQRIIDIHGVMA